MWDSAINVRNIWIRSRVTGAWVSVDRSAIIKSKSTGKEETLVHKSTKMHEVKWSKVKLLLLNSAFTIIQYSRALYNSITPSAQAFFSPFGRIFHTACSLTVGAPDVFIAFITEVPILHLGEVLYLRYRVFPGRHPSW